MYSALIHVTLLVWSSSFQLCHVFHCASKSSRPRMQEQGGIWYFSEEMCHIREGERLIRLKQYFGEALGTKCEGEGNASFGLWAFCSGLIDHCLGEMLIYSLEASCPASFSTLGGVYVADCGNTWAVWTHYLWLWEAVLACYSTWAG